MPIVLNGATFNNGGTAKFNGTNLSKIIFRSGGTDTTVWQQVYTLWGSNATYTGGWTNIASSTIGTSEITMGTDSAVRTTAKINTSGYGYITAWVRVNKPYDSLVDMGIWSTPPTSTVPDGGWTSGYVTHVKKAGCKAGTNTYHIILLPVGSYQGSYYYVFGHRGYGSEYLNNITMDNGISQPATVTTSGANVTATWSNGNHTLTLRRSATGTESSATTNTFTVKTNRAVRLSTWSYSESNWDNYSVSHGIGIDNGVARASGASYQFRITGKARSRSTYATWEINFMDI